MNLAARTVVALPLGLIAVGILIVARDAFIAACRWNRRRRRAMRILAAHEAHQRALERVHGRLTGELRPVAGGLCFTTPADVHEDPR